MPVKPPASSPPASATRAPALKHPANAPASKPSGPGLTPKDVGMGLGCLVLVGLFILYVITGVQRFLDPPRPENIKPPVRETRSAEEKKVRKELETFPTCASWQGDQASTFPLDQRGPEVRPGVSRYDFCNRSGTRLWIFFDGEDIFKLEVPDGASVAVELRSGVYDHLIVAPKGVNGLTVAPFYQRVTFQGVYHDTFQLGDRGAKAPCPGEHEVLRTVP